MRKPTRSNNGFHPWPGTPETPEFSVTVYCGASRAARPEFLQLAGEAGRAIAEQGWHLVYGGGSLGLMGRVAQGALAAGGRVTGVTTVGLEAVEPPHPGLTRLEVVESMHRRKERMTDLGDAFLVLPGGFGTLDEMFEALTWRQLGIHHKPVVLLNYRGYFDPILEFVHRATETGLLHPAHAALFDVATTVPGAIDCLAAARETPAPVLLPAARSGRKRTTEPGTLGIAGG